MPRFRDAECGVEESRRKKRQDLLRAMKLELKSSTFFLKGKPLVSAEYRPPNGAGTAKKPSALKTAARHCAGWQAFEL